MQEGNRPRFSKEVTSLVVHKATPHEYFKMATGNDWRRMFNQGRAIAAPTARQLEVSMVPHPLDRMQVSPRIS